MPMIPRKLLKDCSKHDSLGDKNICQGKHGRNACCPCVGLISQDPFSLDGVSHVP